MKKKIIFFVNSYAGGAEKMTVNIAGFLPKEKYEIVFYILGKDKGLIEQFIPKEYKINRLVLESYQEFFIFKLITILKREQPEAPTIHRSHSLSVQIQLQLKDGNTGTECTYANTKQVLDILGIPFEVSDRPRNSSQPPHGTTAPVVGCDEQFVEMSSKYGYALKQKSGTEFTFYSTDGTAQLITLHYLPDNVSSNVSIKYPSDLEVFKQYRKISSNAAKWQKLYNTTMNELTDALNQFTTSKQIMDNWPEMIPFLPALLSHPSAVLALPKARINELSERLQLNNLQ